MRLSEAFNQLNSPLKSVADYIERIGWERLFDAVRRVRMDFEHVPAHGVVDTWRDIYVPRELVEIALVAEGSLVALKLLNDVIDGIAAYLGARDAVSIVYGFATLIRSRPGSTTVPHVIFVPVSSSAIAVPSSLADGYVDNVVSVSVYRAVAEVYRYTINGEPPALLECRDPARAFEVGYSGATIKRVISARHSINVYAPNIEAVMKICSS